MKLIHKILILSLGAFILINILIPRINDCGQATTIDDVHPTTISVEQIESFIQNHTDENIILFVTPFFHKEAGVSEYPKWTSTILNLSQKYSFSLGLHGCTHSFYGVQEHEFLTPTTCISTAEAEFARAFNYSPEYFRAPMYLLNIFNYVEIKQKGMKNCGWFNHGDTYHPWNLLTPA